MSFTQEEYDYLLKRMDELTKEFRDDPEKERKFFEEAGLAL